MSDATPKSTGTAVVAINWSHGRPRTELRRPSDGGTPGLPSVESVPMQDPSSGRFVKGNRAARRRSLKAKADGVSTLNPAKCESWLAPSVRDGAAYAVTLLERFQDPALARLVGATADAHAIYRALLSLGAQGDGVAMKEARAWLAEHRACLRELSSLAAVRASTGTSSTSQLRAHIRGNSG